MPNSFVTNLYLTPTRSASAQRLSVTSSTPVEFGSFDSSTNVISFDVQTADVFMTLDGSTPSTTNGHKLYAGRAYSLSIQAARVASFIADSSTAIVYGTEMSS